MTHDLWAAGTSEGDSVNFLNNDSKDDTQTQQWEMTSAGVIVAK